MFLRFTDRPGLPLPGGDENACKMTKEKVHEGRVSLQEVSSEGKARAFNTEARGISNRREKRKSGGKKNGREEKARVGAGE